MTESPSRIQRSRTNHAAQICYISSPSAIRAGSSHDLGVRSDLQAVAEFWPRTATVLHPAGVSLLLERLVPLGMLVVAAISVPVMLLSPSGLARLEALRDQRENLSVEVARLEREIGRLRFEAENIKTSPSSVERVARDELGLVRRTELVMQFKAE
jgi:cell division protein FtsB